MTSPAVKVRLSMFQSSPTPKGGRYECPAVDCMPEHWFQSSPTPKGGRYHRHDLSATVDLRVSILAHPERWALQLKVQCELGSIAVSILAHPERWALLFASIIPLALVLVSILAHPERWALRAIKRLRSDGSIVSILAHPERWALLFLLLIIQGRVNRFNPRPPRKVGATWGLTGTRYWI